MMTKRRQTLKRYFRAFFKHALSMFWDKGYRYNGGSGAGVNGNKIKF